jgi:hypothetical protein
VSLATEDFSETLASDMMFVQRVDRANMCANTLDPAQTRARRAVAP